MSNVPKMRSIRDTAKMFKEMDPKTEITESTLRTMIAEGTIPAFKTGIKYLINVDLLIKMFYGENTETPKEETPKEETQEAEEKRATFIVDANKLKKLKIYSATQGKQLKEVIDEALSEYMENNKIK